MKRLLFILAIVSPAYSSTYYVSQGGSGTTCSLGSPCTVAYAVSTKTVAGDTIYMNDGTYTGAASMITCANKSGTVGNVITIRALNDGEVYINGQGTFQPVGLSTCSYWSVEGINASSGPVNSAVAAMAYNTSHSSFKRCVFWDASREGNDQVVLITGIGASNNLLEDIGVFGNGHKSIAISQDEVSSTTVRRLWGQWEYTTHSNPKATIDACYVSRFSLLENVILTWHQRAGTNTTEMYGVGPIGGGFPDAPLGGDVGCHTRTLGSIFYLPSGETYNPVALSLDGGVDELVFKDIAAYVPADQSKRTISWANCKAAPTPFTLDCATSNLVASSITLVGGASADPYFLGSQWVATNFSTAATVASFYSGGGSNLWTNTTNKGATICKRYVDGVLTTDSLWPWPMNQRIYDAMTDAGATPVNVTTTMEGIWGSIPGACRSDAGNPIVSPSTGVANQSATIQFTSTDTVTWTCSGTTSTGGVTSCAGSIDSNGLYTAPSTVIANHQYGGMQILPNNHVYNVRIDSMPVHSSNTLYMATVNQGGSPNWLTDFPINYVSTTTSATDNLRLYYSPQNDGVYQVPSFPTAKAENGWFNALQARTGDHHVIMVDTAAATLSEIYQYYPNCLSSAASVASNVATITCSVNPVINGFVAGSTVVVAGFTGADTFFNVASTSITAVSATSISYPLVHANAVATSTGSAGKAPSVDSTGRLNASSALRYSVTSYALPPIATDAAGMQLQPLILGLQELERAVISSGSINHAFRNTFGIAYLASSNTWPATTYANDASTVPFGMRLRLQASFNISSYSPTAKVLLRALQRYGTFAVDGGNNWPMNAEVTRWPSSYYEALAEIQGIALASSMEFVDESSLMISPTSGKTTVNREMVTATKVSGSSTTVDVVLVGPAVNLAQDHLNIMAGVAAQQFTALNNFGGVTWTMNPSTGSLTSGGLFTPPSSIIRMTSTTVTATSVLSTSTFASMVVSIFPSTGIYVIPSKTTDYMDSRGNNWSARSGIHSPDTLGCCACDSSASFASVTDNSLYNCQIYNTYTGGDTHMDFLVPNGTYQVVYRYGPAVSVNSQFFKLSVNSTEIHSRIDATATVGQYGLFTSTTTVVTNNQISVGSWGMNDNGGPVSSLSIVPTFLPSGVSGTGRISGKGIVR